MVKNSIEIALSIIEQYPEISVIDRTEDTITIDIKKVRFCLWLLSDCDYNSQMPFFTAVEQNESFPHLLIKDIKLRGQNHRFICLYESEVIVKSLFSSSEKIEFIIKQLLKLINLSSLRQEEEYQKEFLFYWNKSANDDYEIELFITTSDKHSWLNVYYDTDDKKRRLVYPEIFLNDMKGKKLNEKVQALYIPIIDNRNIIPPNIDNSWTVTDVLNILDNKQFNKISSATYNELLTYSYSKKMILIVFEMQIGNNRVAFSCEIIFKNSGTMKLLKKIEDNTENVKLIRTIRCDYEFLNTQIGNDTSLIGKKVALIGCGSLGSYILTEIIKVGIKDVILFDNDKVYPENLMRHRGTFFWCELPKTNILKFELERVHPQIKVTSVNQKITAENIIDLLPQDVDLVIFAVGSSDVQLECNHQLKSSHYNRPVLFCWLEGNGEQSHVLGINYSRQGCYRCLYTDTMGNWINNKINTVTEANVERNVIRNGCGGTRIAYGNAILLQTVYMTLKAINKVFSEKFECNFLISFNGDSIIEDTDSFYERSCPCCNGD